MQLQTQRQDMDLLLECKGLNKSFAESNRALFADLSFNVQEGEILSLKGPNGSGKTTLLKILAGLLDADSGEINFTNVEFSARSTEMRKNIGFSPTGDRSFFENITARANLLFFGKLFGMPKPKLESRIEELANDFQCMEYLDTRIQELSSGYKKRFSLIRSIIHSPKLLLLDEPFAHLDPEFLNFFPSFLDEWVLRNNSAAIISNHLIEEDGIPNPKLTIEKWKRS